MPVWVGGWVGKPQSPGGGGFTAPPPPSVSRRKGLIHQRASPCHRFTEEVFAMLINVIFVYEAFKPLFHGYNPSDKVLPVVADPLHVLR